MRFVSNFVGLFISLEIFSGSFPRTEATRILQDTGSPTSSPTVTPPPNNRCVAAQSLPPGASVLGTTIGATFDGNFRCGEFNRGGLQTLASGVWYAAVGSGRRMRISTCSEETDFGTAIQLFTGTCDGLSCLSGAGSISDAQCDNAHSSSVTWDTRLGTTYYFLILGRSSNTRGNFRVSLTDFTPPSNDLCVGATPIGINGPRRNGSTVNATTEGNFRCGEFSRGGVQNFAPGSWYGVVGTGNIMEVDTCSSNTDFPTAIQVFQGNCESLACRSGAGRNGDSECPNGFGSRTRWESVAGRFYPIMVFGRHSNDEGSFSIAARDFPRPMNDDCVGATPVRGDGSTIFGTTRAAKLEGNYRCGEFSRGGVQNFAPAVWYAMSGTGGNITVSTCSPGTTFPTGIQVLTGTSCSSFSCLRNAGSYGDPDCSSYPFASKVTFPSVENQNYFIIVFGRSSSVTGDFGLTVADTSFTGTPGSTQPTISPVAGPQRTPLPTESPVVGPPLSSTSSPTRTASEIEATAPNDRCRSAKPLPIDASFVTLSTTVGAEDDPSYSCSVRNLAPGVWFTITGNGRILEISTCHGSTNFDTSMQIFTGTCDGIRCTTVGSSSDATCGNSQASKVVFDSVSGRLYHLLVFGRSSNTTGNFGVTVKDLIPPTNDVCRSGLSLPINGPELVGTTVNATYEGNFRCGEFNRGGVQNFAPGVWFTATGTGRVMEISTCSSATTFPTALQVLDGRCHSLSCLSRGGRNSDATCSNVNAARVRWDSRAGVPYNFLVFGRNQGTQGDFSVSLKDFVAPVNNVCRTAKPLIANGVPTRWSTTNATNNGNFRCGEFSRGGVQNFAPPIFFTVTGTGGNLTLSTCHEETTLANSIQVLRGTCDGLACQANAGSSGDATCQLGFTASKVTWPTTRGTVYTAIVFGRSAGTTGDVALSLTDTEFVAMPTRAPTTPRPNIPQSPAPVALPRFPPTSAPTQAPTRAPTAVPSQEPLVDSPATPPPVTATVIPSSSPLEGFSGSFRQQLELGENLVGDSARSFEQSFGNEVERVFGDSIIENGGIITEATITNVQQTEQETFLTFVEYLVRYIPQEGTTPLTNNEFERALQEYDDLMDDSRNRMDFETVLIQQGIAIQPGSLSPPSRTDVELEPSQSPSPAPTVGFSGSFRQQLELGENLVGDSARSFEQSFGNEVERVFGDSIIENGGIITEATITNIQQTEQETFLTFVEYLVRYIPQEGTTPLTNNEFERALQEYDDLMDDSQNRMDFETVLIQQGIAIQPGSLSPPSRIDSQPLSRQSSSDSVGAIVGGVLGGLVCLVALGAGLFLYNRRRRNQPSRLADQGKAIPLSDNVSDEVTDWNQNGNDTLTTMTPQPSVVASSLASGGPPPAVEIDADPDYVDYKDQGRSIPAERDVTAFGAFGAPFHLDSESFPVPVSGDDDSVSL